MLVFRRYDPNFMAASLDEAYLDITEVCKERTIKSGEVSLYAGLIYHYLAFKCVNPLLSRKFAICRLPKNSEPVFMKRLVSHVVLEWHQIGYWLRFECYLPNICTMDLPLNHCHKKDCLSGLFFLALEFSLWVMERFFSYFLFFLILKLSRSVCWE